MSFSISGYTAGDDFVVNSDNMSPVTLALRGTDKKVGNLAKWILGHLGVQERWVRLNVEEGSISKTIYVTAKSVKENLGCGAFVYNNAPTKHIGKALAAYLESIKKTGKTKNGDLPVKDEEEDCVPEKNRLKAFNIQLPSSGDLSPSKIAAHNLFTKFLVPENITKKEAIFFRKFLVEVQQQQQHKQLILEFEAICDRLKVVKNLEEKKIRTGYFQYISDFFDNKICKNNNRKDLLIKFKEILQARSLQIQNEIINLRRNNEISEPESSASSQSNVEINADVLNEMKMKMSTMSFMNSIISEIEEKLKNK